MRVPFYIRLTVLILTTISLFWFPWIVTVCGMFLSGLIFPPFALAFGIIGDILYYPGSGLPVATLYGSSITIITLLVRYFVKTRIM
jgi:hypothetical protein